MSRSESSRLSRDAGALAVIPSFCLESDTVRGLDDDDSPFCCDVLSCAHTVGKGGDDLSTSALSSGSIFLFGVFQCDEIPSHWFQSVLWSILSAVGSGILPTNEVG